MQYAILCTLLCTALRCPCAAKTGVTQRMTLRGFAAKTDASALAMHLPDAFQVGSGAGGAAAPKAAYAPSAPFQSMGPIPQLLRIHRHAHADDERRARAARLLGWVSAVPGPLGEAVQKVIAYPAD